MMLRLLSAVGAMLELGCAAAFLLHLPPGEQQALFWGAHLLGSLAGALLLLQLTPAPYNRPAPRAFALYGALCLTLPVLGLLGLLLAVWPAFVILRRQRAQGYRQVRVPELPYRPLEVRAQPIYGLAGMIGILRHATSTDRRVKAVMATRQMSSQEAIPVLKEALRDPADDVRLLAYAMLDAKEEAINAGIRQLQQRLQRSRPEEQARLHERISGSYWELAYLGLAQGEVLRHVRTQALEHLERALTLGPTEPGLHVQHGRLLLGQRRWHEALAAFDRAVAAGVPAASVAPYQAEIAFEQRDFTTLRDQIAHLGASARKSERLAAVAAYWS